MLGPITLLKDLVSIPSVNPMGRTVSGPEFYETRVTEYLVNYLKQLNVPYEQIDVAPGRSNVIARYESTGATRTVLLDAHQDTVPVDGMTISPFDPVETEGRIYGRGSCDVKGGLSAMLWAFTRLSREKPASRSNVILSLTCDEEATSIGVNHLINSWSHDSAKYSLCPSRPDEVIVAEPTLLDVVVAHRGATRWKMHTIGRACHSSKPHEGINAIYRMAHVVECLENYASWLPGSRPANPLCGPATLSVGRIEGGSSVNVVPDGCSIEVDRRVIPGENPLSVRDELINHLREKLDFELQHDAPYCASPPLGNTINQQLAEKLLQTANRVHGGHQTIGVAYGTHASRFDRAGIPAVVFGPGDIAQAHTKDEWIEVTQVERAAEVYFHYCTQN